MGSRRRMIPSPHNHQMTAAAERGARSHWTRRQTSADYAQDWPSFRARAGLFGSPDAINLPTSKVTCPAFGSGLSVSHTLAFSLGLERRRRMFLNSSLGASGVTCFRAGRVSRRPLQFHSLDHVGCNRSDPAKSHRPVLSCAARYVPTRSERPRAWRSLNQSIRYIE